MGRMRVGEWRVAGRACAPVAGGSVVLRGTVSLLALVLALLAFGQASAGAVGLAGPGGSLPLGPSRGLATSAAVRAHELGYSLTPSTTEPYAQCPRPGRGEMACMSIVVPPGAAGNSSLRGASSPAVMLGHIVPSEREGTGERGGLSPSELRSAYGISATGGSGQTVAIVDAYDDPNAESDLQKYREKYKLEYKSGETACTAKNGCFKKVNQRGEEKNYPEANSEWAGEISLDEDMVSAICSECHILLIEASEARTSDLFTAEAGAYVLGATEISNSWAGPEWSEETSEDHVFAEHPGVPVTFAAGDDGYEPEYPAASPDVISVGGTTLRKAEGSRGWRETAWDGSGGGCSVYELKKPPWQSDTGCSSRTDNDVAAVASPETPVSTYDSYENEGWRIVGGTSVSTPIIAGVEAHASEAVRDEGAEAFYRHSLFDVTEGGDNLEGGQSLICGNYLCDAEEGYDGPTGWGTPDGPIGTSTGFHAVTASATKVSSTSAVLNGYVDPEGQESTYRFEYGKTTSYGRSVPASEPSVGSGVVWKAVQQSITGLEWETTYHYRLVATNKSGTKSYGQDHTFVTTIWAVQPDPSGEATETRLSGISCTSSTACTAVGTAGRPSEWSLVAERWNGTEWQVQSTPKPTGALRSWFSGVSCSSSTACTAVGSYRTSSETETLTLAERWNGTEWQVQSTPSPIGAVFDQLSAVSCTSSTTCVAVGWYEGRTLSEYWNGTEWQIKATPIFPEGNQELGSVSCTSTTACVAVGGNNKNGETDSTLAERWNGTEWQVQSTPNFTGVTASTFSGVSCTSSTACTAVGHSDSNRAIAERWNGTEWTLQVMPVATEMHGVVVGVSCWTSRLCIAAGEGGGEAGNRGLLERESLPAATTEAASASTGSEATLKGTVNPEESDTHYYFEYGLTTSYGSDTSSVDAGSGTANVKISQSVSGLKEGTTYYFRLVASDVVGVFYGANQTLRTGKIGWRVGGATPAESVAMAWKGKVKLSIGSESAECEDAVEGSVGPSDTGEVTKSPVSGCTYKICESGSTFEAVNLPWHTELATIEGATRELFSSDGHGEPGYKLSCKVVGIKTEEVCIAPTLTASTSNGSGGVTATFVASDKLNCNSKSGTGTLEGTQTVEAAKGGKLSAVSAAEAAKLSEAEWRLGGSSLTESITTVWKGKVKLSETSEAATECEETAEGPALPGATGEITKLTISKCAGVKPICETGSTLEPLHLPWHTELVTVEGVTRDVLVGNGSGEPGYTMKCKFAAIVYTSECTGAIGATTTNGSGGVTAALLASEKLLCTREGKVFSGAVEGSQTIEASKGGKLEAT